jgi:hypothetical protein
VKAGGMNDTERLEWLMAYMNGDGINDRLRTCDIDEDGNPKPLVWYWEEGDAGGPDSHMKEKPKPYRLQETPRC